MSTKDSPIEKLRGQATAMAVELKKAERGVYGALGMSADKLKAVRAKESIVCSIVMDDKIIKATMPWEMIKATDEAGIVEFIVQAMQEKQPTIN